MELTLKHNYGKCIIFGDNSTFDAWDKAGGLVARIQKDIFDSWFEIAYARLLLDGLHPNTQGHESLYNAIKPELEKLGII
jgi:lysophospholipase L1-like esterase